MHPAWYETCWTRTTPAIPPCGARFARNHSGASSPPPSPRATAAAPPSAIGAYAPPRPLPRARPCRPAAGRLRCRRRQGQAQAPTRRWPGPHRRRRRCSCAGRRPVRGAASRRAIRPEGKGKRAAGAKHLRAVVAAVDHGHAAVGGGCDAGRMVELAGSCAVRPKGAVGRAARTGGLHAAGPIVRHHDPPVGGEVDAARILERPLRAAAVRSDGEDGRAVGANAWMRLPSIMAMRPPVAAANCVPTAPQPPDNPRVRSSVPFGRSTRMRPMLTPATMRPPVAAAMPGGLWNFPPRALK